MLRHLNYTFYAQMTMVTLHQAIRQRTWEMDVQSLKDAVMDARFLVPDSVFNSPFRERFEAQQGQMVALAQKLIKNDVYLGDAAEVLPGTLLLGTLIEMNGWNMQHSLAKRMCTKAQREIRSIAQEMARQVKADNPILRPLLGPQCDIYGRCPETKPCSGPDDWDV
jgi:thymidylate synthase (FAD)